MKVLEPGKPLMAGNPIVTPRPASTLILLRDTAAGPEVLMLKRSGLSDVLGDAYVFPGGKLDATDLKIHPETGMDESPARLQRRLSEASCDPETAAGLYVAAIRETFEESGILMVEGTTQQLCAQVAGRLGDGLSFGDVVAELKLRLGVSQLVPWSRWITPVSQLQATRYDTRFFVARAPFDALAQHDGYETTEARWMQPRQALHDYWTREISLAPPQIMTLIGLSASDDVASVLLGAQGRIPSFVEPVVLPGDDGLQLCYPGDPDHPRRERVMPGPLRLAIRNGRYEPALGFDAFFE
jgi:8-oxo-dGTP pyrophosphatase MutT (NUDIX family)